MGVKRFITILFVFILINAIYAPTLKAADQAPVHINNRYYRYLDQQFNPQGMEVTTQQGQILYTYHDDKKLDPASTAKLMTIYLVLEATQTDKVSLKDKVKISSHYAKMSQLPNLTTVPLQQGKSYTVEELLKQALIESSNVATFVLADKVSHDTSAFTDQMNKKAKQLGMNDTHFTNPSGANNDLLKSYVPKAYKKEHASHTTAHDMSILMHALLDKHNNILDYTKIENEDQNHRTLNNTNLSLPHLVDGLKGADGLKTGTSDNGYNLMLTVKRDHFRVNVATLNVRPYPSQESKHASQQISNALAEQVFDQYEYRKVMSKGKHDINGKTYEITEDLYDVVPKDNAKYKLKIVDNHLLVDYPRQFLKNTEPPSVTVQPVTDGWTIALYIISAVIGLILLGMIIIIGMRLYYLFRRS